MSDIVTTVSTAITLAKRLKEISSNIQDAEFKNLLADLSLELANAKLEIAVIQEKLLEKDRTISDLKKSIEQKQHVYYEGRFYWTSNEDEERDGPFCQKCYDTDEKLIRLQYQQTNYQKAENRRWYECKTCKSHYSA